MTKKMDQVLPNHTMQDKKRPLVTSGVNAAAACFTKAVAAGFLHLMMVH
jgi:hypothetical protein